MNRKADFMLTNRVTRAYAPTTTLYDPAFSARAIGTRTNDVGAAVSDVTAEEDRLIHAILSPGILDPFDGFSVSERGAGPNMSVDVGSGAAKTDIAVLVGSVAGQGTYLVRLDDPSDNLTIAPADPSLDRIDEVYVLVQDDVYDSNGTYSVPRLAVRKGDPAASPTAPGPDTAWKASLLLATVNVSAGSSTVTDSDIVDERSHSLNSGPFVPTGTILPYGGSSAPTGFLLAQGQAVSRTTYAALFAVIGTSFGAGDGSTTFNLPNMQQRFPLGKAASGTGAAVGAVGGSIDHTHTGPSHTHTGPNHTHTGPSHNHSITHNHSANPPSTASTSAGSHDHGGAATSESSGDGSGPNFNIAGDGHYHDISASGSHTHNVDIPSFTSGPSSAANTGNDGTGVTGSGGTGATGSGGTGATGSQNPPFVAVNYIVRT